MSSRYAPSDFDATESRPDKPLIVKCNYENVNKRITFSSSRTCNYDLLKHRVEQCFSLKATPYAITYTDDDGETTDITNDSDLTEAIRYFHPGGDDPPLSSAASILSGRSFGRGKVTLRVKISVDYDGPSLSDTSSTASMDDYKDRNGSESSFSLSPPMSGHSSGDVDDDSVTVSSKDMGSKYDVYRNVIGGPRTIVSGPSREPLVRRPGPRSSAPSGTSVQNGWDVETVSSIQQSLSISSLSPSEDYGQEMRVAEPSSGGSPMQSERSAAWLRDQTARTIKLMLGDLPAPSESDEQSLQLEASGSTMSGELALQKDQRGKFYYAYTSSGPSAPPSVDSGYEESSVNYEADGSFADSADIAERERRPTSMEMSWIESQARITNAQPEVPRPSTSNSHPNQRSFSEPLLAQDVISPDIPAELLPFITTPAAPPKDPTDCSQCHALLETFRYVCSTCGEKEPARGRTNGSVNGVSIDGKGKGKEVYVDSGSVPSSFTYPPSPPRTHSSSPSVSSWTLVADGGDPFHDRNAVKGEQKPLPALPPFSPSSSPSSLTLPNGKLTVNGSMSPKETGFELCPNCIGHYGMLHAVEPSIVSSPGQTDWPPSPEDAQRTLSQWRRTASKKGQMRHAYYEKVWGPRGWDDVEQDDRHTCKCSTCNTTILSMRYKCMACEDFNLCKACYSQVHEIHPSHVFLVVPDKPLRTRSEPTLALEVPSLVPDESGELSMTHPGVKCFHCLQDIIGARFHCAVCPSVDICSNCESAGLPGNLDSSDDGHNSSHIMIKIPYPLPTEELQSASRRAQQLWGQDAATIEGIPRSRRTSLYSSYARTVLGSVSTVNASVGGGLAHGMRCKRCNLPIVGVRFQCANCPSKPEPYSLCSECEPHSYAVHDPMHVFFKLHRPVDIPLENDLPFLPILYRAPAGPPGGAYRRDQPNTYLTTLLHPSAVCDLCTNRIKGEWFRCVYCAKDLCDTCEAVDTHDCTHFFMVFKSAVDMRIFRQFAQLDREETNSPPVVQYPVYRQ
ncbi:hypothetical protein NM688_g233 [Phlebia brevispora]|uniref:Uncharacterized protein n=1 Tax=Phlebia brevispora TaxID=194682 RepID=A0ACC1TEY7_9APHY|nr:hypothetical protein NM688_g233 [Phlebia brevispora]